MATVVGALLASQIASLRMVDHPMQDGIPIASQRRSHSNLTSHETSLAASCIKATPPRTAWFAMRDPARPSDHPVSSKIHQKHLPNTSSSLRLWSSSNSPTHVPPRSDPDPHWTVAAAQQKSPPQKRKIFEATKINEAQLRSIPSNSIIPMYVEMTIMALH